MYYSGIYYGNNDYRDYVGHSLGEWAKHLYKAKEFVNGKVRYIYDTASKAGNEVKRQFDFKGARRNMDLATKYGNAAKATERKVMEAKNNRGTQAQISTLKSSYRAQSKLASEHNKASKTIAGHALRAIDKTKATYTAAKTAVRSAVGTLKTKLGGVAGSLINKGKNLVNSLLSHIPGTKQNREKTRTETTSQRATERHRGVKYELSDEAKRRDTYSSLFNAPSTNYRQQRRTWIEAERARKRRRGLRQ